MKQIVRLCSFVLALMMVFSIAVGCSPAPESASTGPTSTGSPTEPEEKLKIDEEQVKAIQTILADEMMRALPPSQTEPLRDAVLFETERYQIHRQDGHCYLSLTAGNKHSGEPSSSGCIVLSPYLYFDSLEHLYDILTKGTLSDAHISSITRSFPLDAEKGFYLPDPHKFFSVTLPEGLEISRIHIYGEELSYGYREIDKDYPRIGGNITILDQQKFGACLNRFNRFRADPNLYRTAHTIPELNAIAYDCTVPAGVFRYVQYCVQTDSKTLYIEETYAVERSNPGAIASDTVPLDITVFGYENGYYFSISLSGTQMRPSIEFLDSFHFKAYTPQ